MELQNLNSITPLAIERILSTEAHPWLKDMGGQKADDPFAAMFREDALWKKIL